MSAAGLVREEHGNQKPRSHPVAVLVFYRGQVAGMHRLDLLVEDTVVVENETVQRIEGFTSWFCVPICTQSAEALESCPPVQWACSSCEWGTRANPWDAYFLPPLSKLTTHIERKPLPINHDASAPLSPGKM